MALQVPWNRGDPTEELESLKLSAIKARMPFDRDSMLNLAFVNGHQYTEWDNEHAFLKGIARDPDHPRAPRPVVNKIRHMVQEAHAKTIQNRPYPDVLPASDDPGDVSYASVALAYVKYLADDAVGAYDDELSEQIMLALTMGEAFMKWTYDPALERPVFECVSPLDLYADPFARKFKACRWIVHSQFMDVQQIEDVYGERVHPTRLDRADQERAAILRDMGHSPVVSGAVVNEFWLKPGVSRKHPQGLFVTWTGKKFLQPPRKFPYNHAMLPFTQIGAIRIGTTQHYTSFVTDERKPQSELNKYHQQSIVTREAFGSPKWWIPDELELREQPDDSPNQVLRGTGVGGLKPEIIQPENMAFSEDGQWLREEMQDVAGLHEVSRGQVPGRVDSARAIANLKETDDDRLLELFKRIRIQTAVGFWQCVMLADQYVPAEKIVTTYSPEGMPEVKRFKLKGAKPGLRVVITMGTGLSQSRAARVDGALNMWREGIVQDPEVMAELLDIPIGIIAPQQAFDIRLARNENYVIGQGKTDGVEGTPVKPNSYDNHRIHIREHNNHRKTGEFQMQPPSVKKMFEFHVQLHELMELRQLQKEAQKQAIVGGVIAPEQGTEAAEGAAQGAGLGPTGEAAELGAGPPGQQQQADQQAGATPPPQPGV